MKKYYKIIPCATKKKNPYVYDSTNINEFHLKEEDFYESKYLQIDGEVEFYANNNYSLNDVDDAEQGEMVWIPLVSEKIVSFFKNNDLNNTVQIIPAVLYSNKKRLDTKYYVLNFLSTIEALEKKIHFIVLREK